MILLEVQEIDDKSEDSEGDGNSKDDFSCPNKNKTEECANSYVKFAIEIEDSGIGISDENIPNLFIDFMKLS